MPPNHYPIGNKRVGFMRMIHAVGFNGIAVILWGAGMKTTKDKSLVGRQ
jgi:hypothetical protein